MPESLEKEFSQIVKIRSEQQDLTDNIFTTLVVALILLPLWLLVGRKL